MAWGQQGSNLYRQHLTLAWYCNRYQVEVHERLTSGCHTIGLNDGEDGLEIILGSNPPCICQKQGCILVWEGDNAPGPDHSVFASPLLKGPTAAAWRLAVRSL